MKVKMILGYYGEPNAGESVLAGYTYLAPVVFPLEMEGGTAHDEKEMRDIAREDFVEYQVFDMEIPLAAIRDWPLMHVVLNDLSGNGNETVEFVGGFLSYEQADQVEREVQRRAFGTTMQVHFTPHETPEEALEEAAMRGVIGEEDDVD